MLGMTAGYTCWILTLLIAATASLIAHIVTNVAEVRKAAHARHQAAQEARKAEYETAMQKSRDAVDLARLERGQL